MSAQPPTPKKGPKEPFLEARVFAVGTEPYLVRDWGISERNLEFLQSLDPGYFGYLGRTMRPGLDAKEPDERLRAGTAVRIAYHHGVESFFALLFATLQAPDCVVGWMLAYQPWVLRKLVGAVEPRLASPSTGGTRRRKERREELREYRGEVLNFIPLQARYFTWEGLVRQIVSAPTETQERLAGSWRAFARDLLDDRFVEEYNSLKHGLRAGPGGFSLSTGPESEPGTPAPPEAMISLGGSEHGSSFFARRTLVGGPEEKERVAGGGTYRFRVRRTSLNYEPRALCDALEVISASIAIVRAHALALNGADPSLLTVQMPKEERLDAATGGRPAGPGLFEMDAPVPEEGTEAWDRDRLRVRAKEITRARRFPGVWFRGSEGSRRAYLLGTALDVWEVVEAYQAVGRERFLEEGDLSEGRIGLALDYYKAYSQEVDEAIAENRRPEEEWHKLYPSVVPPPPD